MELDCNETENGQWQVVDYDNSCKQISVADDVDRAWFYACRKLEHMINEANEKLST